jgi:hypothetical protein
MLGRCALCPNLLHLNNAQRPGGRQERYTPGMAQSVGLLRTESRVVMRPCHRAVDGHADDPVREILDRQEDHVFVLRRPPACGARLRE